MKLSTSRPPVYILGVGLTPFVKPRNQRDYPELGLEAGTKALLDAQITYDDVQQAVACYCYGDSTCGQRVFYQFGMTGIPVYNVNNNCSTGSTGLAMARQFVQGGTADCVMVLGFEKMSPGSLKKTWSDREDPTGRFGMMMAETRGLSNGPGAAQLFGNAGREYMERFGATPSDFAEIARINHAHSQANPYSQFRIPYSLSEILSSPSQHDPLTKLQCCPTSDGAAAAILVSQSFLDARPSLKSQAILIAGQCLATDSSGTFDKSSMNLVGYGMSRGAAQNAMQEAGIAPKDVGVCELHDCFSANEMITLDALGLCEPGTAHEMVRRGDITYGGSCVVNPSGGLISKGHPLGATGIAQAAELVWHLRGWANTRLVEGTKWALQHNLGLGGAVVVGVYRRADGGVSKLVKDEEVGRVNGLSYNPATEARGVGMAEVERIRSKKGKSDWALGSWADGERARL